MLVDVSNVVAKPVCSKPNCRTGCTIIHRHHIRSQHMWVKHFRRRARTTRYQEFAERYYAFLEKDIRRLCWDHHEEVHVEYWKIIQQHQKGLGMKAMRKWSWAEAERLGDALEAFFKWWIKQETPGVSKHKLT